MTSPITNIIGSVLVFHLFHNKIPFGIVNMSPQVISTILKSSFSLAMKKLIVLKTMTAPYNVHQEIYSSPESGPAYLIVILKN